MTVIVQLLCWQTGLWAGYALGRRYPGAAATSVIVTQLPVVGLSAFWGQALFSSWRGDGLMTLAPANAFACAWVLMALPIMGREFHGGALVHSCTQGLVALAALGLAADCAQLIGENAAQLETQLLALGILAAHYCAGFMLCLMADRGSFPWAYPAWFAAWVLITAGSHPALAALPVAAVHGLLTLFGAYVLAVPLARYLGFIGAGEGGSDGITKM